jgi:hypothetical protein
MSLLRNATNRVLRRIAGLEVTEVKRQESCGVWSDSTLARFAAKAADVRGDFAEIGVAYGRTFQKLVSIAASQGKLAHAFDSFAGMAEPGQFDTNAHPKGQFDVGGHEAFARRLDESRISPEEYRLWEGWIPDCFRGYDGSNQFSFAIVDVDHYEPTRLALDWIWLRTSLNGLVLLDDFSPDCADTESTKAISEFLRSNSQFEILDYYNFQLMIRKVKE